MATAFTNIDRKYGLPEGTMGGLVRQESGGNAHAVSSAGAKGLVQAMPGTRTEIKSESGLDAYSSNTEEAVSAGAYYLSKLYKQFDGDLYKALAAYNAGAGRVRSAVAKGGANWLEKLPKETRDYVPGVLSKAGITTDQLNSHMAYEQTGDVAADEKEADWRRKLAESLFKQTGMDEEQAKKAAGAIPQGDLLGTMFAALLVSLISKAVDIEKGTAEQPAASPVQPPVEQPKKPTPHFGPKTEPLLTDTHIAAVEVPRTPVQLAARKAAPVLA